MTLEIRQLQEFDSLARQDARQYPHKRELFSVLAHETGRHFIGIVGPRGAGKTVLLKQLAVHAPDSFYIALDTLKDQDIFDIAKKLSLDYGMRILLLDEVHFLKNFDEQLKKIFDFVDVRIIFSSSVSLSMYQSAYDLSRRMRLAHLFPFSFREYIAFKTGNFLPRLTLDNLVQNDFDRACLRYEYLFEDYLRGGLMPFALEEPDLLPLLKNVLQKIITRDIPSVHRLEIDELTVIEKTVSFIARSGIEGINYSSISRNVGISKYKAEQYVNMLKSAFVLNPAFPAGANVLHEPKVLMCLPYRLLYKEYTEALEGLREDFFAEMLRMAGLRFSYLKSTRGAKTPDFLIGRDDGDIVVEVGGKGKGHEQFKGISAKKSLILAHSGETTGIRRPLFLLGFIA